MRIARELPRSFLMDMGVRIRIEMVDRACFPTSSPLAGEGVQPFAEQILTAYPGVYALDEAGCG
jgi:hypothetical protein